MTDSFSKYYAKETEKTQIREAVQSIANEARKRLPARNVASRLLIAGINYDMSFKGRTGGDWYETTRETLRRIRDGELSKGDNLLLHIANRNLSATTRTPAKRK